MTMATYTIELKDVIERIFGTSYDKHEWVQEYHSVVFNQMRYGRLPFVDDWGKLGLGYYPIFDERYRDVLNGKIVDEYFNREIGTETIDNFLLIIRKKMDQIMPFYNNLYESEKIKFDPLSTIDITTDSSSEGSEESNITGSASSNSVTKSGSRTVSQELPQVQLSGNGDYATSAADANSDGTIDGTNTSDNKSDSSNSNNSYSHSRGFQGVASDLLIRYRNSILNIDTMILSDIEDCFMLVLNTADSYSDREWI